jgi:hypothetical protein
MFKVKKNKKNCYRARDLEDCLPGDIGTGDWLKGEIREVANKLKGQAQ